MVRVCSIDGCDDTHLALGLCGKHYRKEKNQGPERRLYWVWADMKSRCLNQNHRAYKNYGGRGISVCAEWDDFKTFREDMGERPSGALLDRVDNDGPYAPGNCRWTTRQEQNSNRRNCIYVEHSGERVTLREYCRRERLKYRPIVKRIRDRGWTVEEALRIPVAATKAARKGKAA